MNYWFKRLSVITIFLLFSVSTLHLISKDTLDLLKNSFEKIAKDVSEKYVNNSTKSPTTDITEVFQQIDHQEVWLYSAFYDHVSALAGKPQVRVFGYGNRNCLKKIYCKFAPSDKYNMSSGEIKIPIGHHNVNQPPLYVECPLSPNEQPTHVSVSFQTTGNATNLLPVVYPGPRIRNFTVCYSVLQSNFNMAAQLIENIEMNRILGAEHFMVYNYSISPEVDEILRTYQQDGLLTVFQWPLPTLGSWYYAQITALNDCFYRSRNVSRFVVVVDTDEFIIPRTSKTWMELIHKISPEDTEVSKFFNVSLSSNKTQTFGCFIVPSSFFIVEKAPMWEWASSASQASFKEDEKKNILKYNISTLSQLMRGTKIHPHTERSKYIARPERVYVAGVHETHGMTSSESCFYVSDTLALTHHYRKSSDNSLVSDTSALKYKDEMYARFMTQIKRSHRIFTSVK